MENLPDQLLVQTGRSKAPLYALEAIKEKESEQDEELTAFKFWRQLRQESTA